MTGANSDHGRSDDPTEQLDEASCAAVGASDRDRGPDPESSVVDEAKETAGDLWDTVNDTVSAVRAPTAPCGDRGEHRVRRLQAAGFDKDTARNLSEL